MKSEPIPDSQNQVENQLDQEVNQNVHPIPAEPSTVIYKPSKAAESLNVLNSGNEVLTDDVKPVQKADSTISTTLISMPKLTKPSKHVKQEEAYVAKQSIKYTSLPETKSTARITVTIKPLPQARIPSDRSTRLMKTIITELITPTRKTSSSTAAKTSLTTSRTTLITASTSKPASLTSTMSTFLKTTMITRKTSSTSVPVFTTSLRTSSNSGMPTTQRTKHPACSSVITTKISSTSSKELLTSSRISTKVSDKKPTTIDYYNVANEVIDEERGVIDDVETVKIDENGHEELENEKIDTLPMIPIPKNSDQNIKEELFHERAYAEALKLLCSTGIQ